jgi:hypothetical protein
MMPSLAVAGRAERRPGWTEGVAFFFCCWVPVVLTVGRLIDTARVHAFALDFHNYYWASGHDVLHGRSPFPPPTPDAVFLIHSYPAGPYGAPAVLLFAPFALLPVWLAEAIFTGILIAAVFFALRLVGVRDWRCYGAAFLWAPVASGIQTANLTLLLTLGVAVLWRFRYRVVASALLVGVLVSLKFFLWPLLIWLLATRRYAAAAWSLVIAGVITFGTWGLLGFSGLRDYPQVARIFARYYETSSYTPFAFLTKLGMPDPLVRYGSLSLGVMALAAIFVAARRNRSEAAALALAIAAALLWSPVVWLHYFALFLVPLAVLNPTFSLVWLLPAILWVCPVGAPPTAWKFALPLVVFALVLLFASRERLRPRVIAAPLIT